MSEMQLKSGTYGRMFDADKMFTYLKGYLAGAKMTESLRALTYMRECHAGQVRNDGQPYAVHPLMMACYTVALNHPAVTDAMIAVQLLHDVPEETGKKIEEMNFSSTVLHGVKQMTLTRFDHETKWAAKERYMNELLESLEAMVCKLVDRAKNLMTMQGTFSKDKIRKNVVETDVLLLPVAKKAKEKWVEAADLLHVLRTNVRSANDILAMAYKVRLTDPMFVNPPDAKDYMYLAKGEPAPDESDD